ncbi:hypothetical protein E3Z27_00430 [Pseudomonas mediterranea]|uniref:MAE_28990/MAE_18760 family HEPN-like nuclease n=1 Tax=Pseudomonas mediterranea TaxID=183795 RepID=UPI00131776C2|nr:MAE_28990/MAE_18760 family HEPN-like nuclease [Pseudomonas mediterranea]QHA80253.1 hypothetical protein E3Z27_00430 [Pseudomonas mediterranea]
MSNLSNVLETDLNWRESELASFKISILSAGRKTVRESALLRGAWAILYSHYEGFCKFAWDSYLDELEKMQLPRSEFCSDMAALSLRKNFKKMRGALSDKDLWDFGQSKFAEMQTGIATFDEKLETDSNLWPNLYRDNAKALGVSPTYIDTYATEIKTLVARRNDIAHGQKMTVKDIQEYQEYENAALLVMHDLALCLIEAFESGAYKFRA